MSLIIGSINNELNIIRAKYREAGECSESYIKYYNQVEQPTHVKEIITEKLIDFDYFGGYSDRLIDPLVYWNGFFIQPYRITALSDLIKERKILHNDKIINDINEISEYIFAYKEGFELGYEKFDSIEIENKSSVFKSDKLSIDKIINYIENHKENDNGGFTFHSYAESKDFFRGKSKCVFKQQNGTCSEMKGEQPRNICEWCDLKTLPDLNKWKSKGIEGGKYYRAWFIVLANYQIFDGYFHSKPEAPENIFVPIFNEDIIEDLFVKLGSYFAPKEQFKNFLSGIQIEGKINFTGNQNQLAGIFILSKEIPYVTLGTHQQTFDFIKHTFLIKGKPIVTKQILSYLIEPGAIDKFGNLKDETKPGKANRKTFIDISI